MKTIWLGAAKVQRCLAVAQTMWDREAAEDDRDGEFGPGWLRVPAGTLVLHLSDDIVPPPPIATSSP